MVTAAPIPPIAGGYVVDPTRKLPDAGGGVPAFAVADRRAGSAGGLMALAVPPGLAPRARALTALAGQRIEFLLPPLAHGPGPAPAGRDGARALYVICPAPPGPSLAAASQPWTEAALLDQVLQPAALVLHALEGLRLTHRAIRPDNLFHAGRGQKIVLGAAWAAPPGMYQPAVSEPPYAAMCLPAARGEGSIADDVYALGVLLLGLALGAPPLAGLDADQVIQRKLAVGSFEALVGTARLPPLLADLLRGMLAEDPEHRPPPALLADPAAARARRVAARPPRRAQLPLRVGAMTVGSARGLAYALATAPEAGWRALRSGAVDVWMRRELGDTSLAMRLEEELRLRGGGASATIGEPEAALLARAVAVLDPLAPLAWHGLALWPDGMGGALAEAAFAPSSGASPAPPSTGPSGGAPEPPPPAPPAPAERLRRLGGLITTEALVAWGETRGQRDDPIARRAEARLWRGWLAQPGPAGGLHRLIYELNPLLPCAAKVLAGRAVTALAQLPAALEEAAGATPATEAGPIDAALLAFIAARQEPGAATPGDGGSGAGGAVPPLAQMEVLARLQTRYHPAPLPGLAHWLAIAAAPLAAEWHLRARRAEIGKQLAALAGTGTIAPMLALLRDPAAREADRRGQDAARAELARLDATLAALERGGAARAALARRWGQEMAAGIGIAALAAVLGMAALG